MVSSFEIVDQEYIKELKDKSVNENTKNSTELWEKVFKNWANERNLKESLENDVLDQSQSTAFRNSVISLSMLLTVVAMNPRKIMD